MAGEICLAVACTLSGTICIQVARSRKDSPELYVIGQGDGTIATAYVTEQDPVTGETVVESGSLIRTLRSLMQEQDLYLKA
jgi:2-methylaconitate cis-trans-isomerase PrpF